MKRILLSATMLAATLAISASATAKAPATPHAISAAVADKARPAKDVERDSARKPAELLAFGRVYSGMKVGELLPGGGYFTRLLSKAVGEKGAVYSWIPESASPRGVANFLPVVNNVDYTNVSLVRGAGFTAPEKLDLVWTSQNYHDLHHKGGNAEGANAAAFAALKPGGYYFVTDHAANVGTGDSQTDALHRIDPELVKKEVAKAGFKLVATGKALTNSSDDHTKPVFAIHDKTDQFVFLFQKPRK